jgi:hypothetical protein
MRNLVRASTSVLTAAPYAPENRRAILLLVGKQEMTMTTKTRLCALALAAANGHAKFLVGAAMLCCALQAAQAREIEAGTALICDTQQQAEKVAAILRSDAPGIKAALAHVNEEEDSPSACGLADVEFLRGSNIVTIRTESETFEIAKIMVIGVLSEIGIEDVAPKFYFSIFKIEECGA